MLHSCTHRHTPHSEVTQLTEMWSEGEVNSESFLASAKREGRWDSQA